MWDEPKEDTYSFVALNKNNHKIFFQAIANQVKKKNRNMIDLCIDG